MLDDTLRTFVAVAEEQSFGKAAERLYLSANAIKKRINALEENVGAKLFERTVKGEILTKAGKSFYADTKVILSNFESAAARAREIQDSDENIIKIGERETFSDEFFMNPWKDVREALSKNKVKIVYYGQFADGLASMMRDIGENIDLAVESYDENLAKSFGINALRCSDFPVCCAVPRYHSLAGKKKISAKDLSKETFLIIKEGTSPAWDEFRKGLLERNPKIKLEDIEKFNLKMLSRCENENKAVFVSGNWKEIYPFLDYIPLEWDNSIPFGVYYSKNASIKALDFLSEIEKHTPKIND